MYFDAHFRKSSVLYQNAKQYANTSYQRQKTIPIAAEKLFERSILLLFNDRNSAEKLTFYAIQINIVTNHRVY